MQLKQLGPEEALHPVRAPLRQAAPSSRQFASHRASRSRRIRCVASLPFAKPSERFLTTRSVRRCYALALARSCATRTWAPTRFLHAFAPQHLSGAPLALRSVPPLCPLNLACSAPPLRAEHVIRRCQEDCPPHYEPRIVLQIHPETLREEIILKDGSTEVHDFPNGLRMLDNGKGLDAAALLNWAKDGKSHSAKTVRCRRQERVGGARPDEALSSAQPSRWLACSPDGRAHQLTC
jgi:hypothetical protein